MKILRLVLWSSLLEPDNNELERLLHALSLDLFCNFNPISQSAMHQNNSQIALITLICISCCGFGSKISILPGKLDVSAPPLLNWRVSASSFGAVILVSQDGIQTLSLERFRHNENSDYSSLDYCYICIRPSGRPPGRVNFPPPKVTWSSPCVEVDAVNNCSLVFTKGGNLALHEGIEGLWQTCTEGQNVRRMEIQNSGNFVLLGEMGRVVWQSFGHRSESLGCVKEMEGYSGVGCHFSVQVLVWCACSGMAISLFFILVWV